MTWSKENSRQNESGKIKWEIVPWTRGRGLDLGCSVYKTFPHFIGVDNCIDNTIFGHNIVPDVKVETCEKLDLFASGSMDFIFSSHMLEHIPYDKCEAALKEWWRLMKRDGYLVIYVPDEDEYPKVGEDGANPDHKWNVNKSKVMELMATIPSWDLIDYQKRNEGDEYSLYFVFRKVSGGHQFTCDAPPDTRKKAGVVRYGAYGDLLQASSVYAGLRDQGYHVTGFMTPPACQVLDNDPHIDRRILQDKDQVPNHMLGDYWDYWKKKFDKWVNLSESVEGTFLAIPGRAVHSWTPTARHRVMNHNYLEVQHQIAEMPHKPQVKFYPSLDEKKWARSQLDRMGEFNILWSLAGSSPHKTWPHLDRVLAALMVDFPGVHVVLVGGEDCRLLQQGWENEPRVHQKCGDWEIRQSLTFATMADLVIGPETGIMNAICCEPMPKVIFLSHSTHENLTRDWINTYVLYSKDTTCPGRGKNEAPACHQLHYNWTFCQRGPTKAAAQCQEDITFDEVYELVWNIVRTASVKVARA
jgi:ADP-heptose:LPS heptosyltransferase